MRIPRVFLDLPLTAGADIALPREARQHIERVLRLKPGHPLIAFNGRGGQFQAELLVNGQARLLAFEADECESPLPVRLIQGISKGERMDVTLQKATELGASRISPVTTSRSVVRLDEERAERRITRWSGILQSACEQCGRNPAATGRTEEAGHGAGGRCIGYGAHRPRPGRQLPARGTGAP